MKLTIDERIKHRLVGLAVILSVAAILLPAILKKSSQPFDAMSRVAVRLPARPAMPNVSVADEAKLFKTMKVAKVALPAPTHRDDAAMTASVEVAPLKEEPLQLSQLTETPVLPTPAKAEVKVTPTQTMPAEVSQAHATTSPPLLKQVEAPVSHRPMANLPTSGFTVQVANFSSVENAKILISKLQSKGYRAQLSKQVSRRGVSYKVMVGNAPNREAMVKLQKQLYSKMQLQGFVVTVNVG